MDSNDSEYLLNQERTRKKEEALRFIARRKRAYRKAFKTSRVLLEDLARFCRAEETTFRESERLSCLLEGRREVWLRIQDHINLTDAELFEKYK